MSSEHVERRLTVFWQRMLWAVADLIGIDEEGTLGQRR